MSQKISRKSFLQASLLVGAKIGLGATGLALFGCDPAVPAGDAGARDDAASGSDGGARDASSGGDAFTTADTGTAPDASEAPDAFVADTCTGELTADISNNHGHELVVPFADIMAGTERTYDATGTAGHCHRVVVTAADFASLRAGGEVRLFSCNGGDHEYALSCAGPLDAVSPVAACTASSSVGSCA